MPTRHTTVVMMSQGYRSRLWPWLAYVLGPVVCMLLSGAGLDAATPFYEAAPLTTGNAYILPVGEWDLNAGLALEQADRQRLYQVPDLGVSGGLLESAGGFRSSVEASLPWLLEEYKNSYRANSVGNGSLGLKLGWDAPEEGLWEICMAPRLEFNEWPLAARQVQPIGDVSGQLTLPLILGLQWEQACVGAEFEAERGFNDSNPILVAGLNAEWWPYRGLDLMAEFRDQAAFPDGAHLEWFNAGFSYNLDGQLSLQASAGRAYGTWIGGAPDLLAYAGLQWHCFTGLQ
jgi:hypothetical protein